MSKDFKTIPAPANQPMKKCKCGGSFALNIELCGVTHTLPTCTTYDELDIDELIKTRGALAMALYMMEARAQA